MDSAFTIGLLYSLPTFALIGLFGTFFWFAYQAHRKLWWETHFGVDTETQRRLHVRRRNYGVVAAVAFSLAVFWTSTEKVWFRPEIQAKGHIERELVRTETLSREIVVPPQEYQSPKEGLDLEVRRRVENNPDLQEAPQ